jgi:hypothetical protein
MLSASDAHNELRGTRTPEKAAAPYGLAASSAGVIFSCPVCNGSLVRIWRRPIDRLSSKFVPVHRFRCEGFSCGWVGNLRVEAANPVKKVSVLARATSALMVALVLVTSIALIITLGIAVVGWTSSFDQLRGQVGFQSQPHTVVIQVG